MEVGSNLQDQLRRKVKDAPLLIFQLHFLRFSFHDKNTVLTFPKSPDSLRLLSQLLTFVSKFSLSLSCKSRVGR